MECGQGITEIGPARDQEWRDRKIKIRPCGSWVRRVGHDATCCRRSPRLENPALTTSFGPWLVPRERPRPSESHPKRNDKLNLVAINCLPTYSSHMVMLGSLEPRLCGTRAKRSQKARTMMARKCLVLQPLQEEASRGVLPPAASPFRDPAQDVPRREGPPKRSSLGGPLPARE